MATTLDTTALYGGRPSGGSIQQRAREAHTWNAYNEARHNRTMSTIWAVVAVAHIMIVIFAFGAWPTLMQEISANPAPAIGLAIWIFGDIIYLCFYQQVHASFQAQIDRLEGKTPHNRR
jgi:hypothetical protein